MKIAGIVAEYNPFHNGHKYHIEQTKQKTLADAIVAVMSGNFVQRGDCAIMDKWSRAHAAILGGADLVIELPVYYALGVAPLFSFGAVSTLNSLGCVDFISFGMEEENLDTLYDVAKALSFESEKIEAETKKYLDNYTGYPAAREKALCSLLDIDAKILQNPNNTLAIEYMRALFCLESTIKPIGITRIGAGYHDASADSEFSSATAIRKAIFKKENITHAMPKDVYDIFTKKTPTFTQSFDKAMLSFLRRAKAEELKNIIDMPSGFENRIISMAKKACSIDELVELCCARQYTRSRIRRLLFASFIGIQNMGYDKTPSYIRVLGANKTGRKVLSKINSAASIPIITKTADFISKDSDELFLLDVMATDLYNLGYDEPDMRTGSADFTTSPIML
ncbi:MAG: nucleotidyltransferase [Ruminococcaceae bacterium]|nr:nucleotidyltransferase [Oscillospiraceae bacterium]